MRMAFLSLSVRTPGVLRRRPGVLRVTRGCGYWFQCAVWEAKRGNWNNSERWWLQLEARSERGRSRNSYNVDDLGLGDFLRGAATSYTVEREAGALSLTKSDSSTDGVLGSFSFSPSPTFVRDMAELGYEGLSAKRVYELTSIDVTTVKRTNGRGENLSADDLIERRIHGG